MLPEQTAVEHIFSAAHIAGFCVVGKAVDEIPVEDPFHCRMGEHQTVYVADGEGEEGLAKRKEAEAQEKAAAEGTEVAETETATEETVEEAQTQDQE